MLRRSPWPDKGKPEDLIAKRFSSKKIPEELAVKVNLLMAFSNKTEAIFPKNTQVVLNRAYRQGSLNCPNL